MAAFNPANVLDLLSKEFSNHAISDASDADREVKQTLLREYRRQQ